MASSQSHLLVNRADGIGEGAAAGYDQHRAARCDLGRLRARPAQALEPFVAKQAAADLDDKRATHSRPSTDSATAAATSPP